MKPRPPRCRPCCPCLETAHESCPEGRGSRPRHGGQPQARLPVGRHGHGVERASPQPDGGWHDYVAMDKGKPDDTPVVFWEDEIELDE